MACMSNALPFNPTREALYTPAELFAGFDPACEDGFMETRDLAVYRWFVANGRAAPTDPYARMMQALHDNAVNQALLGHLQGRRVAAIMGGHAVRRDAPSYLAVAHLARKLAREGFLMASGGGPGAMEATHLGALLRHAPAEDLAAAVDLLARAPAMPHAAQVVAPSGAVDAAIARAMHAWFRPAWELAAAVREPGESLAVPTWHYGHEATTPLATRIAKYFQNSIREDGLLAIATHGVVYSPGKAGTLQEVFQDACQNFYHSFGDCFSPMVFYGVDFWRDVLPVRPLLEALFALDPARAEEARGLVLFTDDVDEIVAFLTAGAPTAAQAAEHWQVVAGEAPTPRT